MLLNLPQRCFGNGVPIPKMRGILNEDHSIAALPNPSARWTLRRNYTCTKTA